MHPNVLYGAVYNSQGTQATETSSHRRREAKDVPHTFMDYDRNPHKRVQWCWLQQQGRGPGGGRTKSSRQRKTKSTRHHIQVKSPDGYK